MNTDIAHKYRRQLLATVSSFALLGSTQVASAASDADRPPVWIELNWQFDRLNGMGDAYLPPFTDKILAAGFKSPAVAEDAIPYAYGAGGSISFQPEGSNWIFSASVRYGRSHARRNIHEQTAPAGSPKKVVVGTHSGYLPPYRDRVRYAETFASNSENHAIIDFQAGKDVGLGIFGGASDSTLKFGLRYAQFQSRRSATINADPDFTFPTQIFKYSKYNHAYHVTAHAERTFRGLGPSLSWNGSIPLAGNSNDGEIAFDLGVNGAVLFGRQKTHVHHQTTGAYYKTRTFKYQISTPIHRSASPPTRSRNVTVPNLGGFAGISFRYSDAKISLGYRGDFFFGAVDGGIDAAKKTTLGFNGPFASISFGLGD